MPPINTSCPDKYKDVTIFAWNLSIGPTILKLYKEWGAK